MTLKEQVKVITPDIYFHPLLSDIERKDLRHIKSRIEHGLSITKRQERLLNRVYENFKT